MATEATFTIPADEFPLGSVFERLPGVTVELERIIPARDVVVPYFWVRGTSVDDIEDAFADHPGVTNIRLVDSVEDEYLLRFEETDAELTREPLPAVEGDERQLRQLLQNLLSNAVDYSGDEPPRIHVSAEADGEGTVISVSDDGIGIEAGDEDRIFEVFQRLHSIDEQAGSGIGLALCQRIVERHEGELWVDSEPGEGSTFSFALASSPERGEPAEVAEPIEQ